MRGFNMKPTSTSVPPTGRDGRLPSLLTVNVANMSDVEVRDALDIADLSEWTMAASQVNLSLSKKGRWKAVESLKTDLESGLYSEKGYSVFVIERCWINRQSNCEEVTASKAEINYTGGFSHLFNAETLLSKKRNKPKRKQEKRNGNKNDSGDSPIAGGELPPAAELRVEIVRPYERCIPGTPVTSRRRRGRFQRKKDSVGKYQSKSRKSVNPVPVVDDWAQQAEDWGQQAEDWGQQAEDWTTEPVNQATTQVPNQVSSKKKRSLPKRKPVIPSQMKRTLPSLALDFELDLDCLSEEGYEEEEEMEEDVCQRVMTLNDFFVNTDKTKVRTHRQDEKKRTPVITKGNIISIDENEFSKFAPDRKLIPSSDADDNANVEDEENCAKSQKKDLKVALSKDDVLSSALADTFGERYIECACNPRRFLLDMTGAVREVPHWLLTPKTQIHTIRNRYQSGRGRAHRWFTSFSRRHYTHFRRTPKHVTSAGFLLFEEERDGQFSLTLETDADVDVTSWMSEIETSSSLTPQSLVDSVCDLLNKQDNTSTRVKPFDFPTKGMSFGTLKNLLEWPEAEFFQSSPFPAISNKAVISQITDIAECCSICYGVIDMSSRDSRGLSLTSCGHWFCNGCWRSHVTTSVANGGVNITCPEFGCKSRVDEGTMASFLTLPQLRMYKSRLDDIEIQTSGSKLWCPKPGCGRIVVVREGTSTAGCVRCDCGSTFCIQCRGHPHWPADCSHLKRYETDLKRFGDDSLMSWTADATRVVKGKKCPECQSFIEKNMGCPNMVCRCGFSFCWQCLKPWDTHAYNPECYTKSDTFGSQHLQDVYMEDLAERPQSRTREYMTALASRHKQQHRNRAKLASHVTKMKRELKRFVSRHKLIEAGAFKKSHARREKWTRDAEQVRHLLEETETKEGKHLLDWALNLIYEIHHVIEYSAILIDHHKRDPRLRCAPSLVKTLMFLVSRMEVVFEEGMHQKMNLVPVKLSQYANMAIKTLAELCALKPYLPTIST